MPLYQLKCLSCGETSDYFTGKVVNTDELEQKACKRCGKQTLKKTMQPINSANFVKGSSRQSLKTRTGVGEVQFARGAKEVIDKANE